MTNNGQTSLVANTLCFRRCVPKHADLIYFQQGFPCDALLSDVLATGITHDALSSETPDGGQASAEDGQGEFSLDPDKPNLCSFTGRKKVYIMQTKATSAIILNLSHSETGFSYCCFVLSGLFCDFLVV